jgi:hypothetical protein
MGVKLGSYFSRPTQCKCDEEDNLNGVSLTTWCSIIFTPLLVEVC